MPLYTPLCFAISQLKDRLVHGPHRRLSRNRSRDDRVAFWPIEWLFGLLILKKRPTPLCRSSYARPSTSHFNDLPVEIQVEIFLHCLPPYSRFSVIDAPLSLCRVCGSWRSLVLATPQLWASFEVAIEGFDSDHRIMDVAEMWLERSKRYPLSIRISHLPEVPDQISADFLARLIPELRRCRRLEVKIPPRNLDLLWNHHTPVSFSVLQYLSLQPNGDRDLTPRLELSRMPVPWHQLAEIDFDLNQSCPSTLQDWLGVLLQTKSLIRCSMTAVSELLAPDVVREPVFLPKLERLQIAIRSRWAEPVDTTGSSETNFMRFLCLLSVPNLQGFEVRWIATAGGMWASVHSDFVTFLQKSSCSLNSLSLAYLPVTEEQLLECLSVVPRLVHLDLRFSLNDEVHDFLTDNLLKTFTHTSSCSSGHGGSTASEESLFLPHLRSIHFQCLGAKHSRSALVTMIQSRWRLSQSGSMLSPGALKQIRLLNNCPPCHELQEQIKDWNNEGLSVVIEGLYLW